MKNNNPRVITLIPPSSRFQNFINSLNSWGLSYEEVLDLTSYQIGINIFNGPDLLTATTYQLTMSMKLEDLFIHIVNARERMLIDSALKHYADISYELQK